MQVLLVYAHPEEQSYNAAMRDAAVAELSADGHTVSVSDLYARGFNAVAGPADFTQRSDRGYFSLGAEQMHASKVGGFAADVQAELDSLLAADLLILQFPLWWFSLPAILKGWIDRVFAFGAAYDFGRTWENGVFVGKRAMLSLTASAPAAAFMPDGRNGDMERVLWPIHAGVLALCGFSVLPPFIVHGVPFIGAAAMQAELDRYRHCLRDLGSAQPLFFHPVADYEAYRLAPGIEPATPGQHRGPRRHLPDE